MIPKQRVCIFASALLALLSLISCSWSQTSEPRRLQLSWATSEFLYVEGTRLRLQHRYALDKSPSVWMEAEHGSSLSLEANKTVISDPAASGGRCVAYVDRLEFVIDVVEAGAYQSWARCFFPFAASWNHTEGFDPKAMRVVKDIEPGDKDKAGKWIWLKGPVYQLTPGACTYTFDGYHGGAKLDRVMLTRDPNVVPQDIGQPASNNLASHTIGWAETRDLRLGNVAKWLKLEGLPATGASTSVSLDGAKSWLPLSGDGSLSSVPVKGNGKDQLRIRLALTRTETDDPIVENIQLAYVPGEQKNWTIGNKLLRLSFDPITGSILNLRNLGGKSPVACMISGEQQPLFSLYIQKPEQAGSLVPLTSLDGEITDHSLSADGRRLTMNFSLMERTLLVRCTAQVDDTPLTRWNLRVTNNSKVKVFGVQFPVLSKLRIGDSHTDDVMVLPWWGPGSRTENPAEAEWSTYRKMLNYPGAASMQWLDLYDPSGGLYVAAYDPTCHDLELGYTQNLRQSVNVTFRKSMMISPGKEWSCDYTIGIHPGDWHWGADRYREWARTWRKPPHVPAWLADTDGWVMPSTGANLFTYPTMPQSYRLKEMGLGMSWLQCWMQMTESEHCCGQFHYPSPLWGTPEDFRWGVQGVHDLGGRVGFYINAQLFKPWHNSEATNIGATPTDLIPKDVLAPYDPQWASRWQAKDFADRPYDQPSSNPYDDGVRMNPASSGWQNHLIHWAADSYVEKFGADCIYFDQLSAAPSLPVYDDAKSDYGLWGIGYQQMLTKLLGKVLPKHPNYVMSMEGASDVHGQKVATALYGTNSDYFDAYHYTFPEDIKIDFGAYVNQGDKAFGSPHAIYLNTFLMGTRFCEHPDDEFGRNLFALRRRLKSLIYRATYRDTVGVTASDAAVRVKRFVLDDANCRAVIVNLGNLEKKQGVRVTVDLTPLKRVTAAWVYGLDGSVQPLKFAYPKSQSSASSVLDAPPIEAATVLFIERIGPLVEGVDFPANATTGSLVKGSVVVRNLSSQKMNGDLTVLAPRNWRTEVAAFADLQPGASKTMELAITVPEGSMRDIHDMFVVAKGAGGEDRRYVGLAVVPPIEILDSAVLDDGIQATVRNRSPREVSAICSLDVFDGAKAPPVQEVKLRPGEESKVKLVVAWPDLSSARVPQTVRVVAESEGMKVVRSVAVGPTVVNGSFDMGVVNKDRPEGWPILHTRPDCMHLDTSNPYDGKRCLRIDPAPSSPAMSQLASLQPNTTYRVTVALRRTDAADAPVFWVTVYETWSKHTTVRLEYPANDKTVNDWRVFTTTLKTPPQTVSSWLYACNSTPTRPIWIDAVKIEKVGM